MLVNESGTQFGVGTNCNTAVYALIVNYVQTPTYNYNYCYPQYCWPQPPKPSCNGWNCGVPNFSLDKDMNPRPQPQKPPTWHW